MTWTSEAARRRIAERIAARQSDDVGVRVGIVPAGWLTVELHSANPVLWVRSGVDLHPDGRVTGSPCDDGCTPLGTPHTDVGIATSVDEAVELVVSEAERSITDREHELLWYYTSVEAAIAVWLPNATIADALHRAVDELVDVAGTDRAEIDEGPPSCARRDGSSR